MMVDRGNVYQVDLWLLSHKTAENQTCFYTYFTKVPACYGTGQCEDTYVRQCSNIHLHSWSMLHC